MNKLISNGLWPTIKKLARRSNCKRAAIAYVTNDEFVEFGEGDILVTDASDQAVAAGQTKTSVLASAFKRGALLYSLPRLHSKVLLLDGIAVIGSANLSSSSANSMIEAAWVSDSPVAVGMVTSLISQLTQCSTLIDGPFIRRAQKIKVTKQRWLSRGSSIAKTLVVPEHRTWLVSVRELAREFPKEQDAIEAGEETAKSAVTQRSSDVSWIRWPGSSRFSREAKPGDTVIQIWRASDSKIPDAVYRHCPILHRQREAQCTRFFVEQYDDEDEASLSWKQFQRLARKIELPGRLGPLSTRPISDEHSEALFSLWQK